MIDSELNVTGKPCDFKITYAHFARLRQSPLEEGEADFFMNSVIRRSLAREPVVKLPRISRKQSESFVY
jgi:hypothetical protein